MSLAHQLDLFQDPFGLKEAQLIHSENRHGFFSILQVDPLLNVKRQSSHLLRDMPTVLTALPHDRDTWISQAEFTKPCRRIVHLARLGLLFVDIDSYKVEWAKGKAPEQQAASLIYFCEQEGIPRPSLIIFSGRGLQAKWLFEYSIPRAVLLRWNACQKRLVEALASYGADPAAKDAARVLRLVETVNSKSGEVCRLVHVEEGGDGAPIRYNFEYLAEILLPVSRGVIAAKRNAAEEKRKARLTLLNGGNRNTSGLRLLSPRQLAWDRAEDLRSLVAMRGNLEGQKTLFLHWTLNFLLLSGATNYNQMFYEASALAKEIDPGWGHNKSELSTLYSKAKAYSDGERIEFGDKKYPPLYTPKNDTLISLFEITDDEQRQLKTIISTDMAKERHRERDTKRRREGGAVDRQTYETNSKEQLKPWEAQGISRRTFYRRLKDGTGSCVLQAKTDVAQVPAYY